MSEIPDTINGKIQYFEQHIPLWSADPAAIGLSAQQIIDITSLTGAARVAYNDAQAARQASKSATVTQTAAVASMMTLGTALVATIRAYADASGDNPEVYAAAGIAPPAPPSPLSPPVPATDVAASLLNSGEVRLSWTGTVANGTFYTVHRRLGAGQPFELIGSAAAKSFVDTTIAAGTAEATYFLRTHRDELVSDDSEPITVRFGVAGAAGVETGGGEGTGSLGLAA